MVIDKESILKEVTSGEGRVDIRSVKKAIQKYELPIKIDDNTLENFYLWVHDLQAPPKTCKICSGKLKFRGFGTPYPSDTCSKKCAGILNSTKSKKTCVERYGVPHHMRLESVKRKVAATCTSKYGASTALSTHLAADGLRKKYGVDNISKTVLWKQKTTLKFQEKYGGRGFAGSLSESAKNTIASALGVDATHYSYHQLAAWYRSLNLLRSHPDFSIKNIDFRSGQMLLAHSCGAEKQCNIFDSDRYRCYACVPKNKSKFELEVSQFLRDLEIDFLENDRSVIPPLELDFYIPALNLAIECNGDYWHSYDRLETAEEQRKHLQKLELANSRGIDLIQITEHEWNSRQDIVKSIISVRVGKPKRTIHARKLKIEKIPNGVANRFCEENHIQGKAPASISYGAFLGEELVACYTIGKNRFTKSGIELIRFACLKHCHIPGLFSKFTKHVMQAEKISELESYLDRRLFSGKSLFKTGWILDRVSKPGYCWLVNGERIPRSKTQKHRLPSLLGEKFDPSKSESDNMFSIGARRLWDCGQYVFKFFQRSL